MNAEWKTMDPMIIGTAADRANLAGIIAAKAADYQTILTAETAQANK